MNKYLLGTLFSRLCQRAGVHANPHRFRHTFATWAIENHARELDVQYLLGHSTSAMVRRYSATYDAAKAADAHAAFSPAARLPRRRQCLLADLRIPKQTVAGSEPSTSVPGPVPDAVRRQVKSITRRSVRHYVALEFAVVDSLRCDRQHAVMARSRGCL